MCVVAIMGNGPANHIPDIVQYKDEVDIWIGADCGALLLIEHGVDLDYAVGDFDSVTANQKKKIIEKTRKIATYPSMKDETDLEIAILTALDLKPTKIYLFGITGGRLDHTFINIQMLQLLLVKGIQGVIIDRWNMVELRKPGEYIIHKNSNYPYISFVPYSNEVSGLTLNGFSYPLNDYHLNKGSTRCISNEIAAENAVFTFREGLLLCIQSCDIKDSRPI